MGLDRVPEVVLIPMTTFGGIFLSGKANEVHLLDLETGTCELYTDDRQSHLDRIGVDDHRSESLLMALVDRLIANGTVLPSGSYYHFNMPTVLGGEFTAEDVAVIDLPQRIRFCGDFYHQVKDLPDGFPIKLKILS